MAAASEPIAQSPRIVDLRHLGPRELDVLLLEETVEWQERLDWDFAPSADLIRQFMTTRALNGCALVDRGEAIGYAYTVLEDRKGLIGDLYVRSGWRSVRHRTTTFPRPAGRAGRHAPWSSGWKASSCWWSRRPCWRCGASARRSGFRAPAYEAGPDRGAGMPRRLEAAGRFHIETWADHLQESAANAIALAYNGHIDSQINDQYRSLAGARRFLYNIVQFPGCGIFYKPGSFIAFDTRTGWVAGIVLVSFVSPEVGHITQLCVTPQARGAGLGYELLRQAVAGLRSHGAKRISLTVTSANIEAIHLYRRCSFEEVRRFFAYVWDRG